MMVYISRVMYFLRSGRRWTAIYITTTIATFIVGHKTQDTCLQRWKFFVYQPFLSLLLSSIYIIISLLKKYLVLQIDRPKSHLETNLLVLVCARSCRRYFAQARVHQPVHFLIAATYNKSKPSFVHWIIILYTNLDRYIPTFDLSESLNASTFDPTTTSYYLSM